MPVSYRARLIPAATSKLSFTCPICPLPTIYISLAAHADMSVSAAVLALMLELSEPHEVTRRRAARPPHSVSMQGFLVRSETLVDTVHSPQSRQTRPLLDSSCMLMISPPLSPVPPRMCSGTVLPYPRPGLFSQCSTEVQSQPDLDLQRAVTSSASEVPMRCVLCMIYSCGTK